ncbi:hypothetical protein GW17_00043338 [Ensete ventricosum]|nr:hypothetical protein GW17_00043338 [Ensete ventricosum]
MPLTWQQKKNLNITDLESYATALEELIDVKLGAFEVCMKDKLYALFTEFILGRLESSRMSKHDKSSYRKENPIEKEEQVTNSSCPCMRVDFPIWEDRDPTTWILLVTSALQANHVSDGTCDMFPNSGIGAKEALARGSRAWPRPAPLQGRPAAAKAPMQRGGRLRQGPLQRGNRLRPRLARKGATPARGQTVGAAARGSSAAAWRSQGVADAHGHAAGAAFNDLQTVARCQPQGGTDCGFDARGKAACGQRHRPQRLSPARMVASSGSAYRGGARGGVGRKDGRPLAEWLPAGKGSRRLRRGNSGGAVRAKEG